MSNIRGGTTHREQVGRVCCSSIVTLFIFSPCGQCKVASLVYEERGMNVEQQCEYHSFTLICISCISVFWLGPVCFLFPTPLSEHLISLHLNVLGSVTGRLWHFLLLFEANNFFVSQSAGLNKSLVILAAQMKIVFKHKTTTTSGFAIF